MLEKWLVEIRTKDWLPLQILSYEQVLACDEYSAHHSGIDQFIKKTKYEPSTKRMWENTGLTAYDICAAEAILIEE